MGKQRFEEAEGLAKVRMLRSDQKKKANSERSLSSETKYAIRLQAIRIPWGIQSSPSKQSHFKVSSSDGHIFFSHIIFHLSRPQKNSS